MSTIYEYLDNAVSPYHAAAFCAETLSSNGFCQLKLNETNSLVAGGKYYIMPYPTMLIAFVMPEKLESFHIATAHTDYPSFKLKANCDMPVTANTKRINVEPYGGSLKKTWFDRPLSLAGSLVLKGSDSFSPKTVLYDAKKSMAIIPSLAPHMDRDIEKKEVDIAKEILPITGITDSSLMEYIADSTGIGVEDILSFDLNLYVNEKAENIGIKEELISSERIDNIASCAAVTEALINSDMSKKNMPMIVLYDNEEIGSRSKQGADSNILGWTIKKLLYDSKLINNDAELIGIYHNSYMLSVDGAHAMHPSHTDKADSLNPAYIGKGPALKTSSSQRYLCDPVVMAIIKELARENNIPFQVTANKSGTPGGQTLGPILSSYLPIRGADLGIPMLAMHSARELCSAEDYENLKRLITSYL